MKKITIEYIKEYCNKLGLTCLSTEYLGVKENLEFICTVCGEKFSRTFDNIKTRNKTICNKCGKINGGKKQSLTYDFVKNYIEIESDSGCKLISNEYHNSDKLLKIKCKCGIEFYKSFYKFKSRNEFRCEKCSKKLLQIKNSTPIENIKKMISDSGYKLLDNKLPKGDQKIKVQCEKSHEPYWMTASKFKSGRRCPHCSRSIGEELIKKELQKHKIDFIQEYTFSDLIGVGGGLLRFDFAIFNNGTLTFLVEFDGKQHYEVAFDSESTFKRTQLHDEFKNTYCKTHKIPLLRIPYWEKDNIENRLIEFINITNNKYKI